MQITGWEGAIVVAKALCYAATLISAGSVFFLSYSESLLTAAQQARIRGLIAPLCLAAAASSIFKVMLLAGSMGGAPADMLNPAFNEMILRAGETRSLAVRLVGLSLVCIALWLKPGGHILILLGASLAAVSFALSGHVHALAGAALPTALLMLHLLCAAFWLGALLPLYQAAGGDRARCGALAVRFGSIAAWLVASLVTAGCLLLWRLLDSPSQLWSSDYGRMMSLKILLVMGLLGCAALNKWLLAPGLLGTAPRAAVQLRRSIALEMLLGAMILLVTAAFTSLLGPRS